MNKVFIYALIDPRENQIRYIGKANNPLERLKDHLSKRSLKIKTYKNNWIKSLLELNLKPNIEIIDEILESEWQFWEQHYISLYKSWGFNLTNGTLGGDGGKTPGFSGRKHSNISREKMKINMKGRKAWNKGLTKENNDSLKKAGQKISILNKGELNPSFGKKKTEESKEKFKVSYNNWVKNNPEKIKESRIKAELTKKKKKNVIQEDLSKKV